MCAEGTEESAIKRAMKEASVSKLATNYEGLRQRT